MDQPSDSKELDLAALPDETLEWLKREFWRLDKFEHDRKEKLAASATIPFAAISGLLGGMAFLLPRIDTTIRSVVASGQISIWAGVGVALCLVEIILVATSILELRGLVTGSDYRFLPSGDRILSFAVDLGSYHRVGGGPASHLPVNRELNVFIVHELADSQQWNYRSNNRRAFRRVRLYQLIVWSFVVFVGLAAVLTIVAHPIMGLPLQ